MARDCYKKQNDARNGKLQQSNYASSSAHDDEKLFAMQHVFSTVQSDSDVQSDAWLVDSGCTNHMTSHSEWFRDLKELSSPGYVETGDASMHPIKNVGSVPLQMNDGKVKCLSEVLYVPQIARNLVSVGQCVEQNMQVRFNPTGVYIEDYADGCKLITKGKRQGRMFSLNATMPEISIAMFAHSMGLVADIDIWHKKIGHLNIQRLKSM